jgi:uncharacterized protein
MANGPAAVRGNYLSLTTFKRDGTPVATPVWFVADDERIVVMTSPGTGKVKRIRRDAHVTIATCSARGRVKGPVFQGTAALVPETENERLVRLFERRYRVALVVIKPLRAWQRWRHPERDTSTVFLAITPRVEGGRIAA